MTRSWIVIKFSHLGGSHACTVEVIRDLRLGKRFDGALLLPGVGAFIGRDRCRGHGNRKQRKNELVRHGSLLSVSRTADALQRRATTDGHNPQIPSSTAPPRETSQSSSAPHRGAGARAPARALLCGVVWRLVDFCAVPR